MVKVSNIIVMSDFDLESFVSAPTVEQIDACRKDDLSKVAEYFQISVSRQQLKRDIRRVVEQHLMEREVLVVAGSSPGVNARSSVLGEGEASEAAAAESSEAKAALPNFDPSSQDESGGNVRLKLSRI